ncbi:MAG: M23 family metallopeptidase [Spirochaetales bacterium]|nr:M23 family metallopeptidase [Spirochaetales bacterium]
MKKTILSALFCLLLLFLPAFSLTAETLLSTPHAYPGDILTAVVYQGEAGDEILFMLEDSNGTVRSNAPGLPFEMEELSGNSYIGLLGLNSDLKAGTYKLRAEIRNGRGLSVYERPVLIRSLDFKQEDIPLNQKMSSLRTDDSEARRDQARRLWALLNTRSAGGAPVKGVFLSPVEEFIPTTWYGDRRVYLYSDGGEAASLHNGLDMAAETGTEILTPMEGTVVMTENRIITGNTVVLEHLPGVYTLYYHMDSIAVKKGDELVQGDLLGTLGSTGLVTGPHLHWELRVNTIPVDPERYLSRPLIDKDEILAIINDTNEQGR